ncbi:MAG: hypothetical protein C4558_06155 [Dehalococcoidia bacterium]|nr:MAG: hypothetical protein C4558_06155 [Dehalococcoidia bacterium]
MAPLTCDEVNELAGEYALGLLDAKERISVEEHLAEHWHEEYASARAAVLALASAAPEAEPSPELRTRILDVARIEARRKNRWIPQMLLGAAGAAAVLAVLILSGVLDESSKPAQQLVVRSAGNGAFLELAVEEASSRASIRLGGLPPRPGSEVYQIWLLQAGQSPKSLTVVGADRDGPWTRPAEVRLKRGDTVVVTVEPDNSRSTPTQTPVLEGKY